MDSVKDTPLAVIGMACRVPGANSLAEYWQLLVEGRCAIVEAPPERLDRRLHYSAKRGSLSKTYTSLGGVLQYRPFDAARCPVPARSLPSAEVGHLTICQVAAEACRHAGLNPFELPQRSAGVYVGHNLGGPVLGDIIYGTLVEETAQYLRELDAFGQIAQGQDEALVAELVRRIRHGLPRRGPQGVPVGSTHLGAAIIAEALGLSGPAMILDAACSSALQGLAMAARALQLGRIEMAVVGGASYYHVDSQMLFSRAQSASARGSCPFDASADGLVSGEGYVAVVLKTLPQALADGDPIQAVIRGIGLSSDGRGKSLWAPRKEGQVLAIQRAYERGLDLGRLQYIEAHATSTPVGDVTELKALAEALDGKLPPGAKISIGAVKANIGHTLEAAGLAGLIKTVLAIQHQTIPQQIHVDRLNPGFDWDSSPFVVPTANTPWPAFADGHPRRAAVNSFGIGGLNVHVVLDEFQPQNAALDGPRPRAITPPAQEPIAIVGAGCIFPGARTLEAFWDLLASGRDPKCDVPADRWNAAIGYEPGSRRPWRSPRRRGGFITDFQYDWRRHRVPPNQVAHADPLQLMILDSTDAALADAGYDQKPFDRLRTGVVVGTVFGSDFCDQLQMGFRLPDFCDKLAELLRSRGVAENEIAALQKAYADVLLKHMPALLDETGGFTPSTLASRITKTYDLMGGAATVDSGQASSLAALCSAVDLLLDGTCDVMLCAAGHRGMGLSVYELLALEGKLAGDDPKAPFDAEAHGHLPGEGVGVLVLKRLSDAQRDGDRVRGIIRGVGAAFATSPRDGMSQAIERAYAAAGDSPDEVALLETSGTGLLEADGEEIAAVAEHLASDGRQRPLLLGSVVGQIGHTQGASGMASLLVALKSLEHEQVPARFGASRPAPALAAHGAKLQLATSPVRLTPASPQGKLLAGISSTDTWGAAYHVVLERPVSVEAPRVAEPVVAAAPAIPATSWRIVRIGAATLAELKRQVAQAAEQAATVLAQADTLRFSPEQSCRLAVVVQDAAELEKKLRLAAEQIGTPAAASLARKDICVGQVTAPVGKVAFVFSGQGSQYAGMLQTLVQEFPPAAEALAEIDATLARLGMPRFVDVAWGDGKALGTDVWMTQHSLLCADTIVFRSLQALGIQPDMVAGHSYGEYPALAAAGAWDFENAALGTRVRCQSIEACRNAVGRMLSAAASGSVVEEVCRELGEAVFPANYNAPDQTVVGGSAEGIARLEETLKGRKIAALTLAVPRPFHTPLMKDVKEPLTRGLQPIRFSTPRVPMLSSVTNQLVAAPDEIRANLVAQMVRPVRWVELIQQLADQGVRAIVEVGPRQVLTGLNGKILAGRDVAVLACDDKSRSGLYRLLTVQAALESLGLMNRSDVPPAVNVFEASPEPTAELPTAPLETADSESSESLVLSGTPYELGRQQGEALASAIQKLARRYADVAGSDAEQLSIPAALLAADEELLARLPEDYREELRGVAEGAGVSPAMLAAYNAWLDTCATATAAHAVLASHNGTPGVLHVFDETPAPRLPWADLVARSVRSYRPASGLAHLVVSAPGAVGATAGLNECGLAVSSISASEAALGESPRGVLVRNVLQQAASLDAAVALLEKAAGRPGWEFCLSHKCSDHVCRVRFESYGPPTVYRQATTAKTVQTPTAVVMRPGAGELLLRGTTETGQETLSRYTIELTEAPPVAPQPQTNTPAPAASVPTISVEEYLKASQNVDGQPPFERGNQVCTRFAMRMLQTPIPPVDEALRKLSGPALIVGQNAVGLALRKPIEALGVPALVLPLSDDIEKTLATLEKLWQTHRPPHLFLVTALDEQATARIDAAAWDERRQRGVMLPYLVCQRWFALVTEAKMVEQASVVAATAMGGDFGFSGRVESLESGAMTGLIKALCIEFGYTTNWAFRTKVVDVPRSEPADAVATALLRELRAITYFAEIGYAQGKRYVIGAVPKRAEAVPGTTPTRGRSWLITGGARGITAAIARELGRRFGVKLHLVGTSPRPEIDPAWRTLTPEQRKELRTQLMKQALAEKKLPAELWKRAEKAIEIDRTLRELEAEGIATVYHACDVGDRAAMARLVDEIRRSDGPLEGIVHGAGIEVASRYTKKDPQMVARTIAAKVDGAAILMDLTRDDPLRFFFGFGSVAGRWGSIGQTDYSLASDMLAKLIDWYRTARPECHATCFHWQPWAEIGMAARDETRGGNMLQRLELLPPAEGVQHFVDELLAGCPEPELIVTDWNYYKAFHPDLSEKDAAEWFLPTPTAPAPVASPPVVSAPAAEPAVVPPAEPVTMRHVMRMVELPWQATTRRPFTFAGPALILGDNADAKALGRKLAEAGVEVRYLPIGDTVEETIHAPQWMADGRPAPHLFLMTGRDPEATEFSTQEAWRRRLHRGVILPFLVCQEWLTRVNEAGLRSQASVAAATSLGGDFGFTQPVPAPEGGALTGLLKGLYLETQSQKQGAVLTRIVDLPAEEPSDRVAEALLRELEVEGDEVEVAWSGEIRSVVRLALVPIDELPRHNLPRGGVWVFTGGARGITAAVAKEMGRRFGLKLHLLGKSPLPEIDPQWRSFDDAQMRQLKRSLAQKATREGKPPGTYWDRIRNDLEIDRNLREMTAAGIQVTYHSCDVTDWAQLDRTLRAIRQTDGPIEGIVHGAGIQRPGKTLVERDPEALAELVNVKVDAAVALLLLTRDDPLRYVVGFGSISGRFGTANASAYTMSNDMLAKLLGWRRFQRPECHAVSFHWHPWGEVGMMTRPAAQHTITIMKMKLLPPAEGAWHMIEELRAGAPESEVLITDAQFYETFYQHNLRIDTATGDAKAPVAGALVERVLTVEPGRQAEIEIRFDPVRDPFLREHRLRDKPTLPMVVALEAFAEAASLLEGDAAAVVGVRDVRITDAVRFFADEPIDVRVHAERTAGGVECRLVSDFRNRRGQIVQRDRLHFAGVVEVAPRAASLGKANVPASIQWHPISYPTREALMYHGAPLRLLKQIAIDAGGAWGQIEMPAHNELAGERNAAGWQTPSAALDACYYACGIYVWVCAEQGVTVPDSLAELRLGRAARPSEATVVQVACREMTPKHGVFDFTLIGDNGDVIFQVQGYRCHILRGGSP